MTRRAGERPHPLARGRAPAGPSTATRRSRRAPPAAASHAKPLAAEAEAVRPTRRAAAGTRTGSGRAAARSRTARPTATTRYRAANTNRMPVGRLAQHRAAATARRSGGPVRGIATAAAAAIRNVSACAQNTTSSRPAAMKHADQQRPDRRADVLRAEPQAVRRRQPVLGHQQRRRGAEGGVEERLAEADQRRPSQIHIQAADVAAVMAAASTSVAPNRITSPAMIPARGPIRSTTAPNSSIGSANARPFSGQRQASSSERSSITPSCSANATR